MNELGVDMREIKNKKNRKRFTLWIESSFYVRRAGKKNGRKKKKKGFSLITNTLGIEKSFLSKESNMTWTEKKKQHQVSFNQRTWPSPSLEMCFNLLRIRWINRNIKKLWTKKTQNVFFIQRDLTSSIFQEVQSNSFYSSLNINT